MAELDDINELRGVLERGLTAGIIDVVSVFTRQNAVVFQKDRPRVEITVGIGSATGAKKAFPGEQLSRFVRWNFTVKFEVFTAPAAAVTRNEDESDADFAARQAQNNNLHALLVAHVRTFLSTAGQGTWKDLTNYPNHYIAEALRDAGSPSTLKSQDGLEQTSMSYAGQVGIRTASWPA